MIAPLFPNGQDSTMSLSSKIESRIEETSKADYLRQCKKLGVDSADMLREMVYAFNTGRLRIIPYQGQSVIIRGIHDES
jgi:hypothetical protein